MKYLKNFFAIGLFSMSALLAFSQTTAPKLQLVEITTTQGVIIVKLYNETPEHRDNFIKLIKQGFYDSLLFHRAIPDFMIQGGDPTSKYAPKDSFIGNGDLGYRIPAEINPKLYHKRGALSAARDNSPDKSSNPSQFFIVQGRKFTNEELSTILNQVNYGIKQELFQTVVKSDSVNKRINEFMLRGDQESMQSYMQSLQPAIDKLYEPKQLGFSIKQINTYINVGGAPHLDATYTVFGEIISGIEVVDKIAALPRNTYDRPLQDVRMKMKLIN